MAEMTYRDALNQALDEELARDESVFVMGEEVAEYDGAYKVTKGLLDKYGDQRLVDTPISELGFTGLGVGAAMLGLRPVIEFMTFNFSILALDQVLNHAAKMLYMSGGQFNVPIVIRMTTGAGRQLAAQHSHSLEGWYAHVPGLKVVAPATVQDARWMLPTALADPNPVVMFEHSGLYNEKGSYDPDSGPVDIETAAVLRPRPCAPGPSPVSRRPSPAQHRARRRRRPARRT